MRRIYFIAAVALILTALIFTYSQSPQPSPQTGQTATVTTQSQPVKARKVLVKQVPKELEGITLEKGAFKLKPGYKFVPQPNGTVGLSLQTAGGRGVSGTFECSCEGIGHTGSCAVSIVGPYISCLKDKKKPCNKECLLDTTIGDSKLKLAIY